MRAWAETVEVCLLHFLWQGAAAFVVCALLCRLISAARSRYAILCLALAALALLPAFTARYVHREPGQILADAESSLATVIACLWVAGAAVGLGHLSVTTILIGRLRTRETVPPALEAVVSKWAERIGLRRSVRIAPSAGLRSPAVAGVFATTIYLPLSVLTRLSPAQVESLIVHELVHVKRLDPLVNFIQICIERVYFFHPAVWWISDQIRNEREHLCDEATLELIPDRVVYASALAELVLKTTRIEPKLAIAGAGGSIIERIARILGVRRRVEEKTRDVRVGIASLVGFAGFIGLSYLWPFPNPDPSLVRAEQLRASSMVLARQAESARTVALAQRDQEMRRVAGVYK